VSEAPDAIERLERRVAMLEDAVRRLIALRTLPDALPPQPTPPRPERDPDPSAFSTSMRRPSPIRLRQ